MEVRSKVWNRIAGAVLVVFCARAGALELDLVPDLASVRVGQSFTVDIVARDLADSPPADLVSGFDVDLAFDAGVLQVMQAVVRVGVADGFCIGAFDCGTGPGSAETYGFASIADDDLRSLQMGLPLRLATVTFRALAPSVGATPIDFVRDFQPLVTGRQVPDPYQDDSQPCFPDCTVAALLDPSLVATSVTVLPGTLAAPGSGALSVAALCAWWLARRRRGAGASR
jgi:hypothetical protein